MKKNPMIRFKDVKQHNKVKKATKILFATIAIALTFGFYGADFSNINGSSVVTGLTVALAPVFMIKGEFKELKGEEWDTFKTEATAEEMAEYFAAKNEDANKKMNALIESKASKEDIEALRKDILASNNEIMKAEVIRLATELKALKETGTTQTGKSSLKEEFEANKAKLKQIASKVSSDEVTIKALTLRSFIANNETAYDLPEIGQLATRKLSLYDIFPKLNLSAGQHNGTVRYYDWDEDTIARAAAAVAEGAAFPESTAKFKKGSITLQKIGDTLPVTEEFFEDETLFAAELGMFLETNVSLEIDRQLADGDGTGNTITGLKASVNAYSLPGSGSIVDPTIYDLIVKVSEAITLTGGAKYQPDFAVMNIADINRMKLSKDANQNYILPPFVSRDGSQVSGIIVIESNIITANTMVVGDRRFARIYEMGGIVLSKGMVGTQFTEDELTLKARKRLAFLIRAADKGGFLKVTDIDAALAAIAIV